ncbi:hypothetical protein PUMCH_001279 [Australozyma saopauloensis]|uniref:LicD/FKTN/FKRP nucleotidyltransferase domain-containing protein n=1 Tax=Australozyma saopauloensis TaxID=291208 RepID=A0AAX4H624_9ASCO|nr:hypothetical protein PUMCH_001279 [[Candida] saopauloensis]
MLSHCSSNAKVSFRSLITFICLLYPAFLGFVSFVKVKDVSQHQYSNTEIRVFLHKMHPKLDESLIPWPIMSFKSTLTLAFQKQSTEFDPRLIPALWLSFITKSLSDKGELPSLPFEWDTLLDLRSVLHQSKIDGASYPRSNEIAMQQNLLIADISVGVPIEKPLSVSERAYVAASYLLYLNSFQPSQINLIGIGEDQWSCLLALDSLFNKSRYPKTSLIHLANLFLEGSPAAEYLSSRLIQSNFNMEARNHLQNSSKNNLSHLMSDSSYSFDLLSDDFRFPHERNPQNLRNLHGNDKALFKNTESCMNNTSKYFNEAHLIGSHNGFHYDWRFFKTDTYSTSERQFVLHRTSRAWFKFCKQHSLKTWLAHGSLLGWYWNGLSFPWDEDIDVQMPALSFYNLARKFNQTLVVDFAGGEEYLVVRLYFIDVSPHFMNRADIAGSNVIDARFIDVETGMYVDITALSLTCELELDFLTDIEKLHSLVDPKYSEVCSSALHRDTMLRIYHEDLHRREHRAVADKKLVNCKNNHFYHLEALSPLQETSFEGALALVPRDFMPILRAEYPKGMLFKHFNNWSFRPFLGVWVPDKTCRGDHYGSKCKDEETLLEVEYTKDLRRERGDQDSIKLASGRVDPFLVARNARLYELERSTF